jgi:hypothetical protein
VLAEQIMELLGEGFARQRPQPRPAAAGKYDRIDGHAVLPYVIVFPFGLSAGSLRKDRLQQEPQYSKAARSAVAMPEYRCNLSTVPSVNRSSQTINSSG